MQRVLSHARQPLSSFLPKPDEVVNPARRGKAQPCGYCLDWLLGSSKGRLLGFAGLGIFQILFGACLWRRMTGSSLRVSLWTSWSMFIDTGTQTGEDAETLPPKALLLSVGLSLAGWIYNMTLLGLVLDVVRRVIDEWKKERDRHWREPEVVLLCFNEKTLHFLKQMTCRLRPGWHCVVILADMDAVEMERQVLSHLGQQLRRHGIKVYCRQGSPYDLDHLRRSAVMRAKEIVLLSHSDDDASIIRRMITMGAIPEGIRGNVYVDVRSQEAQFALQTILPGTTIIRSHRMSMRLLCLLAVDPALAACLLKLDQRLVAVQATAAMDRLRFAQLGTEEWFDSSLCIGMQRSEGGDVVLNPPGRRRVRQGDTLLVAVGDGGSGAGERLCQKELLARTKRAEEYSDEHVALCGTVPLIRKSGHGYARHSKIIIILGWPVDADYMLEVIDSYAPLGATVHVLDKKPIAEREADLEGEPPLVNIKLVHHVGNRLLSKDLGGLPFHSADSILVLSRELQADETSSASDAECLLCAVMVMGFFDGRWQQARAPECQDESSTPRKGSARGCIICEMLSPDSERTLAQNAGLKSRCLLFRSHAYEASMIASRVSTLASFMAHRQLLQGGLSGSIVEGAVPVGRLRGEYRGRREDGPLLVGWQDGCARDISLASAAHLDEQVAPHSMAFFLTAPGRSSASSAAGAGGGTERGRAGSGCSGAPPVESEGRRGRTASRLGTVLDGINLPTQSASSTKLPPLRSRRPLASDTPTGQVEEDDSDSNSEVASEADSHDDWSDAEDDATDSDIIAAGPCSSCRRWCRNAASRCSCCRD